MQECLTNGGNKLTGNHPTSDTMLRIKVRLAVLLCAVKTVEGDFRFCWTISPNVGQTHKENPNLVRIFLYDIYIKWYIQTVQQLTQTLIHKNQSLRCAEDRNPPQKCIRLVYEIRVICRALQALYSPQRCELIKKITLNFSVGYSLFEGHRSVRSFGPGFFCLNSGLSKVQWTCQLCSSLCTFFCDNAVTGDIPLISLVLKLMVPP